MAPVMRINCLPPTITKQGNLFHLSILHKLIKLFVLLLLTYFHQFGTKQRTTPEQQPA